MRSYLPHTLENNYLHYEFDVSTDDTIQVILDNRANVKLMDDTNYQKYRAGQQYRYYGGFTETSPVNLRAPRQGHWHLVIDLGGYPGTIHASTAITRFEDRDRIQKAGK